MPPSSGGDDSGGTKVVRNLRPTFVSGFLIGAVMGLTTLSIGAGLLASLSPAATAGTNVAARLDMPQVINRADKSDRLVPLHPLRRATDDAVGRPVIPEGCDATFSPLSRDASANFAGRCLS
jgi:hypothetical protein